MLPGVTGRRAAWLLVILATVTAGVLAVRATNHDSLKQRAVDALKDSTCASVNVAARPVTQSEHPALADGADGRELVSCEHAGGYLELLHFADQAAVDEALSADSGRTKVCRVGTDLIVRALLARAPTAETYCPRLGGHLVGR